MRHNRAESFCRKLVSESPLGEHDMELPIASIEA